MPCQHHHTRMRFYRGLKRAIGALFAVPLAIIALINAYSVQHHFLAHHSNPLILLLTGAQVLSMIGTGYTCLWLCDRLIAQQKRLDDLCPGGSRGLDNQGFAR